MNLSNNFECLIQYKLYPLTGQVKMPTFVQREKTMLITRATNRNIHWGRVYLI